MWRKANDCLIIHWLRGRKPLAYVNPRPIKYLSSLFLKVLAVPLSITSCGKLNIAARI